MARKKFAGIGGLITCVPGVHGGQPCIAGTRIRVQTVAVRYAYQRETPDELLKDWPHLNLAQVHAALAFYYANKAEIDAQIEADDRLGEELAAAFPHGQTRETDPDGKLSRAILARYP